MKVDVTDSLDCGCRAFRNAVVLGLDGKQVEGVRAADSQTGELWVYRHVVEPHLVQHGPRGTVVTRPGMEDVRVIAPFELHCRNHPLDTPTWREHSAVPR